MLHRLRRTVIGFLCGALGACSAPTSVPTTSTSNAVVNGKASPPGSREDAIVLMRTVVDDFELTCSGTLVAKNLVLTARHCVAHETQGPFSCSPQGDLLDDGSGSGRLGLDLPAASLEFYTGDGDERRLLAHGAKVVSTQSSSACVDDLGFVVLDSTVDLPVLPLRVGKPVRAGEAVALTGYGLDETMNFGTKVAALSRHTRDDLEIAQVGPDDASATETVPPRSIVVAGPAGCVGDSGAPLYSRETGAVLGVYSLLAGESCTSTSGVDIFARVGAYQGLIADAFAAAGSDPTAEGELGALGDACRSDAECLDGTCATFGSDTYCSRSCDRKNDCPAGFVCSSDEQRCALEAPATAGAGGEGGNVAASETGGVGGASGSSEGGASGSPEGGAAPAPAAGAGAGNAEAGTRPSSRKHGASRGCALGQRSRASDRIAPLAALLLLALTLRRRRAQRRPSSGLRG